MCCTAGTAKHMGELMCLHVFMHHTQTRTGYLMCFSAPWGKARAFCWCTSLYPPPMWNKGLLLWDLPHLPRFSSPDLVYLIDFYRAGHLYNTDQPLHVCVCVCVCVCVVKASMQRVQIGSGAEVFTFCFQLSLHARIVKQTYVFRFLLSLSLFLSFSSLFL